MALATDAAAEPVALFQGFDRIRGEGRNIALSGSSQSFGAAITTRYQVCEGVQEVMKELEINQSLSIGLFGIANVSQKVEFLNRQRITTHSVCIVVHSRRIEGTETVTNAALRNDIKVPESNAELLDFLQVYGDSYVSSRTTGGEYFGVYSFYSETREEQRQVIAGMDANGIFKAVLGDVGLQTSINNFRASQNIRIAFDQMMTGIAYPAFPDAERVIDFALEYPSLELTAPRLIRTETTGYHRVPGLASRFDIIARNVEMMTNTDLVARLSRALEVKSEISSIIAVYEFYGGFDEDSKLLEVKKHVEADIEAMQEIVRAFDNDPITPLGPIPEFVSLVHGMPVLNFATYLSEVHRLLSSSSHGGVPRREFDTLGGSIRQCLQRRTRIIAIEMASKPGLSGYGSVFHDLRVIINNGERTWTVLIGLPWSDDLGFSQLLVPQGHFVKAIEGHGFGSAASGESFLVNLSIQLTNSDHISVGERTDTSRLFQELTPTGFFLLGFRGTHDGAPTSLQMVYASLRPSMWLV